MKFFFDMLSLHLVEDMSHFVGSTMVVHGVPPLEARTSGGTLVFKVGCHILQ